MPRMRTLVIALALAATLPLGLAHLTGCESTPETPAYDNPFDPLGPLGGDGLQVRASAGTGANIVKWDHHPGMGLVVYILDHRTDQDIEWTTLADDLFPDADTDTSMTFFHLAPEPNRTHYYMVQGLSSEVTEDDGFTITGYAQPAIATTPPTVLFTKPDAGLASRFLDLRIVVGEGENLRIADNENFTDALVFAAAAPGDTALITWDFGPRADGDTVHVHVESFTGETYISLPNSSTFAVAFAPTFDVVGGRPGAGFVTLAPSQIIDLAVENEGVEMMRFAGTEEDLPAAAWVTGADLFEDFTLLPVATDQPVWAEFQGDFGYNHTAGITVRGDLLTDVEFTLDLPDNGVTAINHVDILSTATATAMRFHDEPDFTGIAWIPYETPHNFEFQAIPGVRTIYGQYRNDWADSPIATGELEYVVVSPSIAFITPRQDDVIDGGASYEITGRAISADGVLMRFIQVDVGEGFVSTSLPVEYWTHTWNVPEVTASTSFTLRARVVTVQDDTATTAITVTVEPASR